MKTHTKAYRGFRFPGEVISHGVWLYHRFTLSFRDVVVYASTRAEALKARQAFGKRYGPWYPKAVTVLEDDWDRMVTFYDFPEAHWKHLRTTNVVESPFASVRLRTSAAKRFKRVDSATALIWKLLTVAEKRFRRLDAPHLLKDVFEERKFRDGKPVLPNQRKVAA